MSFSPHVDRKSDEVHKTFLEFQNSIATFSLKTEVAGDLGKKKHKMSPYKSPEAPRSQIDLKCYSLPSAIFTSVV